MPLLQASLDRISSEFAELSSAVEATTHRLPTTGIIVPTTEQLLQELSTSEQTLNDILTIADPHLDKVTLPRGPQLTGNQRLSGMTLCSWANTQRLWKA